MIEPVAASCGYQNTLVFSRAFKQELSMPPSQYRKERRREVKGTLIAGQEELENIEHMKYIRSVTELHVQSYGELPHAVLSADYGDINYKFHGRHGRKHDAGSAEHK